MRILETAPSYNIQKFGIAIQCIRPTILFRRGKFTFLLFNNSCRVFAFQKNFART